MNNKNGIKMAGQFFLSPTMGRVIRWSYLWFLFPEGAAQGVAFTWWWICVNLSMMRAVILLFTKEQQPSSHWNREFWLGAVPLLLFLILIFFFEETIFRAWLSPFLRWSDLDRVMFVR